MHCAHKDIDFVYIHSYVRACKQVLLPMLWALPAPAVGVMMVLLQQTRTSRGLHQQQVLVQARSTLPVGARRAMRLGFQLLARYALLHPGLLGRGGSALGCTLWWRCCDSAVSAMLCRATGIIAAPIHLPQQSQWHLHRRQQHL